MKKMISFGLADGQWGVLEEKELELHVKECGTTIFSQSIASFRECEDWVCMGAEIKKGMYQIADGILNVCGEYDELEFIDLKVC